MRFETFAILATSHLCNAFQDVQEQVRQEPEFREIAQKLTDGDNPFLGRVAARLEQEMEASELSGVKRLDALCRVGKQHLKEGDISRSLEFFEQALELAPRFPERRAKVHRLLGLANLRRAEIQNCVARHNAECCIFPLAGEGIHVERDAGEQALRFYELVLKEKPADLTTRWLYNIVAMTLGEYPDGVADEFLIPPAVFESDFDVGRFHNAAPRLGVNTMNLCGGVVVDDFDGDQLLDIVTSTYDPRGPLTFYRNRGVRGFEDRSEASRSSDQFGGLNLIHGDYDNDGDKDVFVLRGGWLLEEGRIRNSLLQNAGDGTFADVTRDAGLAAPSRPTQAACWLDFDGDGQLDLYVGNESRVQNESRGDYPGQLFHNQGDGTFVDVARKANVENDRYCKGVTAGDFDNDGDVDLYLSNNGPNRLYRNEGDGIFKDVAYKVGVAEPSGRSFACWFFDYDNDGWLDLFVGAYAALVADLAAEALGRPHNADFPKLYRNAGGTFTDVTKELGLEHVYMPMGANFGDIDHDGWLDVYLTTGQPSLHSLMPNVMLRNDGGERFQDVTTSGGFGHLQKGHGIAFADLDHDGDQDLYHQLGGFFPGDRFPNALFLNPGHGNRFLYLLLEGTQTVRDAFGARIRVMIETPAGTREIHRAVGSVSSFGGSPLRQEIGLGQATRIERLEIFWPGSHSRQVFEDVPLDACLSITEGREVYEMVELEAFAFE